MIQTWLKEGATFKDIRVEKKYLLDEIVAYRVVIDTDWEYTNFVGEGKTLREAVVKLALDVIKHSRSRV